MKVELLLIANFLIFLALAMEAKIRSKTGFFIVLTGLIVGVIDLIFVLLSLLR
ncbi:MAG: hypothetical protein N3D75_01035 [Candidatus Aenigmarchaeota archaeon]|nr:hypothetical protein [Candidatus Aenigmarchaeota archaeon]